MQHFLFQIDSQGSPPVSISFEVEVQMQYSTFKCALEPFLVWILPFLVNYPECLYRNNHRLSFVQAISSKKTSQMMLSNCWLVRGGNLQCLHKVALHGTWWCRSLNCRHPSRWHKLELSLYQQDLDRKCWICSLVQSSGAGYRGHSGFDCIYSTHNQCGHDWNTSAFLVGTYHATNRPASTPN